MRWPGIEAIYGPFLRTTPVFSSDKRWEDLHTRVIEHVSALKDKCHCLSDFPPPECSHRGGILHTHNTVSTDLTS
jgi:hypothetical protein